MTKIGHYFTKNKEKNRKWDGYHVQDRKRKITSDTSADIEENLVIDYIQRIRRQLYNARYVQELPVSDPVYKYHRFTTNICLKHNVQSQFSLTAADRRHLSQTLALHWQHLSPRLSNQPNSEWQRGHLFSRFSLACHWAVNACNWFTSARRFLQTN